MGISGLLPLLKSIHKHTTLKKFAGQTLGIDGYGWLHRGSVACAIELALDKPTTKYLEFAVNRVRMLLDFGITPYVVLDGDALPSKAGTNAERRARRDEAKKLGLSLYRAGKISQAYQELQKAATVTPHMAKLLIEELKKMNVRYVVAPYEADAQLAYLEQKGIIDGIISEDSDLLVFGAQRLITKLNQYGECVEIERKDFAQVREISLAGWSDAMFRRMAILSGCDYLQNIDKMGLKTSYRFIRKYKEPEKVLRMIAFEGKFCIPQGYLERFQQAELSFLHHRVFCPLKQQMVFLNELEQGMDEAHMPYLGQYVEAEVMVGVACGDLNPKTKKPIEVKLPLTRPVFSESRRQTVGTPSELKPKKSIENFFKSQRTPLQELDPNSLTPSPSQQRLLERNRNASWDSRPVNSAPQLQRAASALTQARSARSTDRAAFLTRAATVSNYQPPKRQRLCSDNDLTPSKEVRTSPFFASTAPALSPSDEKRSRNRKAKREFDVWSDDSVDDLLLGLTDVQAIASPATVKGRAMQTAKHTPPNETDSFETVPQSPPTQESTDISQCSSKDSIHYSATSKNGSQGFTSASTNAEIDLGHALIDNRLTANTSNGSQKLQETFRKTFSAQTCAKQEEALQSIQGTNSVSSAQPRNQSGSKTRFTPPRASGSPPPRNSMLKTFVYQSPEQQKSALQSLRRVQSDKEKICHGKAALLQKEKAVPRRPEPAVNLSPLRGSEDAIIPNSEDEESISGPENDALRSSMNLKRFIFDAEE